MPDFNYDNCAIIKGRYPNKLLNYWLFKFFKRPKIDRLLGVDLFFMPHINFIALSKESKFILTIHDLSFLRFKDFFSWRKNFWHKMLNLKNLINRADKIITVSESSKSDILDLFKTSPEKIKVIHSGIEDNFRMIDKNDESIIKIRKKYNLPEKFILFLGTIEPRKNISSLIQAYGQLHAHGRYAEYKLVIAGAKGWKNRNIFKAWSESSFVDDIKFIGYVAREDKIYIYNLAKVFVYPSFYEGFGFPPLEAMACGTPVIASYASSLPEILGRAALLIDPYNTADIAEAIDNVIADKELRNDLVVGGLARAKEYKWGKTAGEYIKLFNAIKY